MSEKQYYGFFSAKAADLFGSVIYSTPDNKEVEVTVVDTDKTVPRYKWDDTVFIGPVSNYLRKGRKGTLEHQYNLR